jgi:hypothetical protein
MRRIIALALAIASVVLIARIQGDNLRLPVNPDPIYYFLFDR